MTELLPHILLFLLGFAFMIGGAEFLVRGASRLAARLKVPLVVIGLTVVAFGTSLPELVVSLLANLQGGSTAELAIGNVVGSNIANLALILGVVAVLRPFTIGRELLMREYPLMVAVSLLFTWMAWDGQVVRWEGLALFLGLIGFVVWSYTARRAMAEEMQSEALEYIGGVLQSDATGSETLDPNTSEGQRTGEALLQEQTAKSGPPEIYRWATAWAGRFTSPLMRELGLVALGILILVTGANWLVDSATVIARAFGVSELVIGLSLVALGTSLPELATSAVAILRRQGDIALGNLVGSNLFNMLAIIGITATVRPLPAPLSMHGIDFPAMLIIAILPLVLSIPSPHVMNRWNGALMLALYFGYTIGIYVLAAA